MAFAAILTIVSATLTVSVNWLPMAGVVVIGVMFASGLALGASRTPRDVMLKDAAPPGQIGKVFGFVSAGLPLGGALTPIPFGYLIDRGHPELILTLSAVLLLASLLCVGTARSMAPRQAVTVAAE
jgi:nitrate/nitrite transporter NarK